ncbi:MAG: substrate-binding domain-containing protein [Opitutaceae bacterium]|nr:substrate-binding domain-containing protein [Opitutaceae bacterium]
MAKQVLLFLTHGSGFRESMIARGILEACNDHGWSVFWRDYDRFDTRRFDASLAGIVVWGKTDAIKRIYTRYGASVPVVSAIGGTLNLPIPTLGGDSAAIAGPIAEHLITQGLRDFIYVGWKQNPASRWRAATLRAAFEARLDRCSFAKLEINREERFWGPDVGPGPAFLRLVRRTRLPLGIIGADDQVAASCLSCVELAGFRVPQDVAVVGVDDNPLFVNLHRPLTSVHIDYVAIGRAAVGMVRARTASNARRRLPPERRFFGGHLIVRESSQRRERDGRIRRVLDHLHTHFAQRVSLAQMAQIAGMSRSTFARTFEQNVGMPAVRYLITYRLEQAKNLLAQTEHSVSEICWQVGFHNHTYFDRVFRRLTGLSPREYRVRRRASPLMRSPT